MYSACPHPTWKAWKSWAPSKWRPARRTKLIPHGQQTGRRRMPDPHGGHIGYYVLSILNLPDIWPPMSDKYPNWCVGQVPSSRRGAMCEHGNNTLPQNSRQRHMTTTGAHRLLKLNIPPKAGGALGHYRHPLRGLCTEVAFCYSSALCAQSWAPIKICCPCQSPRPRHRPHNLWISKPWTQTKPFSGKS